MIRILLLLVILFNLIGCLNSKQVEKLHLRTTECFNFSDYKTICFYYIKYKYNSETEQIETIKTTIYEPCRIADTDAKREVCAEAGYEWED